MPRWRPISASLDPCQARDREATGYRDRPRGRRFLGLIAALGAPGQNPNFLQPPVLLARSQGEASRGVVCVETACPICAPGASCFDLAGREARCWFEFCGRTMPQINSNSWGGGCAMPRKYYIIATNRNAVNFANTRQIILRNIATFQDGSKDFGAGIEAYFQCPGCDRELPAVLFDLDHIYPRNRYAQSNFQTIGDDHFVLLDDSLTVRNQSSGRVFHDQHRPQQARATGGYVTIQSGPRYNPVVNNVNAGAIWESDLNNLQFLCGICNSSKQNRTFLEWKPNQPTRPLAKILKSQYRVHVGMDVDEDD